MIYACWIASVAIVVFSIYAFVKWGIDVVAFVANKIFDFWEGIGETQLSAETSAPEAGAQEGALRELVNEVNGWIGTEDAGLRALLGHTNVAVMEHKIINAQAALRASHPAQEDKA